MGEFDCLLTDGFGSMGIDANRDLQMLFLNFLIQREKTKLLPAILQVIDTNPPG